MEIICCNESYTYNAYHIMKAFYPVGNMVARVDEKASNYVEAVLPDGSRLAISREKDLTKKELDRALYRKLKEITGRSLAWGVLTGVRPTKIAMKKLSSGFKKKIWRVKRKLFLHGKSQTGRKNYLTDWIMKMDTVCMSEFHSAQVSVATVPLAQAHCLTGKTVWKHI